MQTSTTAADVPDGFDERLRQRSAAAERPLEMKSLLLSQKPPGVIPNTPLAVSVISFVLGSVFTLGLIICLNGGLRDYWWSTYQLGFYLAAWSAFHWGEFATTAGWNREKCSVDSFLLENGIIYHIAHGAALLEHVISLYFKPSLKEYPYVSAAGMVLVLLGQALRSTAMIHAGTNFSHSVAFRKLDSHNLVTDGIYAWFRHPSYAGFFYWALGTQLVLQNPLSFFAFAAILWNFFNNRIKTEEQALIRFFGQDYVAYRARAGTMIPFIP